MSKIKLLLICICYFLSSTLIVAQDNKTINKALKKDGRSFRDVKLLSSYETVLSNIKQDRLLMLNAVSDFEDFDESLPNWLVAEMPPLMNKIYYHFFDNKLYVISIFFNHKKTSYPELYQALKGNYGKPIFMNANQTKWELPNNTLIVLDSLPSLKYIDNSIFEILKQQEGKKDPLQTLAEQEKALEAQIVADL